MDIHYESAPASETPYSYIGNNEHVNIATLNTSSSGKTSQPNAIEMTDIEAPVVPTPAPAPASYQLYEENVLPTTPKTVTISLSHQQLDQPPLTLRIDLNGQVRGIFGFVNTITVHRAYPKMVLEGKLSEKKWIDEFCDPVDEAFATSGASEQKTRAKLNCLTSAWLFVLICGVYVTSVDESDDTFAFVIVSNFFATLIYIVGACIIGYRNTADGTLERKLHNICNNMTRKCNSRSTSDTGATAGLYNGFVTFSLKFVIHDFGSGRYRRSYKVYHVDLQLTSTEAASRNLMYAKGKTKGNSRAPQSLSYSSKRSAFR